MLHSFDSTHTAESASVRVAHADHRPSYDDRRLRQEGVENRVAEGSAAAPGGHTMLGSRPGCAVAHDGAVTGLLQTPDGRHWVSAGTDNAARLWDTRTWHNCLVRYPEAFNSATAARQIAVDDASQVRPRAAA